MTWTSEELRRLDKVVLVIYKDGETRGSVTLESYEEQLRWQAAIKTLNEKET